MIDNPFANKTLKLEDITDPIKTEEKKEEPKKEVKPVEVKVEELTKHESDREIVERVLREYNYVESDIPLSSYYWTAKGKL